MGLASSHLTFRLRHVKQPFATLAGSQNDEARSGSRTCPGPRDWRLDAHAWRHSHSNKREVAFGEESRDSVDVDVVERGFREMF